MCLVCGDLAVSHSQVDKMFEDMAENTQDAFSRLAEVFQKRIEYGVSEGAILGASFLINALRHPQMPVPVFSGTAGGDLVVDWRQRDRLLEVVAESDGQTFDFVVGQVVPPADGEEFAQLVAQTGRFLLDEIKNLPEGDRGPGLMADWLVGGEFAESLDRYVNNEDFEDVCLASEPGSEPTNIINAD